MQLATRDGISCDLCATTHRDRFTYYSLDLRECVCGVAPLPLNQARSHSICFSLDVCPTCYDQLAGQVVRNYRPSGLGVRCELSGEQMSGIYYYAEITKVEVIAQPAACNNCGTALPDGNAACPRCHHAERTRRCEVLPDPRHLEFHVSGPSYQRLVERALSTRKAASWSASSG